MERVPVLGFQSGSKTIAELWGAESFIPLRTRTSEDRGGVLKAVRKASQLT